ncbi:OmpA family protein [Desulforhopalus sp. 52FAK]
MFLAQRFFIRTFVVAVLFTIGSSGCAKQTQVVLLPDPSGKVGKVRVTSDGGSVDITKAQEATVVKGRQSAPSTPTILTEDAIQKDFSEALQSLPEQPKHFILYFKRDSNRLTDASTKLIPEVLQTVQKRESKNISVIGHTDTAGNPEYNLRLSKLRAQAIADILKKKGLNKSYITTTSHGENNPLIPTEDNVHEPKNRRVEVVVR